MKMRTGQDRQWGRASPCGGLPARPRGWPERPAQPEAAPAAARSRPIFNGAVLHVLWQARRRTGYHAAVLEPRPGGRAASFVLVHERFQQRPAVVERRPKIRLAILRPQFLSTRARTNVLRSGKPRSPSGCGRRRGRGRNLGSGGFIPRHSQFRPGSCRLFRRLYRRLDRRRRALRALDETSDQRQDLPHSPQHSKDTDG